MQTQPMGSMGGMAGEENLGGTPYADVGAGYGATGGAMEQGGAMADLSAIAGRLSTGIPAKPLLGFLPLARVVPQDVHSVADYTNGAAVGLGLFSEDPRAQVVSGVLAASVLGVSAMTDYRLSLAKIVPIEMHEAIDHIWGISAIAAPFLFGYWKTSPKTALTHVVCGATTILTSLFTDYRADRGVGR